MPLTLGIDIGTTKTCALALENETGEVVALGHADTPSADPGPLAVGRREFDPDAMAEAAASALRRCVGRLGARAGEVVGLAFTGQQHGGLLVDADLRPLTPFINWQDGRGGEPAPGGGTWLESADARVGPEAWRVTGCRLASGYLGLTLHWLVRRGSLPGCARACFITDYLGALLTGGEPVTDPTMAASSGLLDVRRRAWSAPLLEALGLSEGLLPPLREAGEPLGSLTVEWARRTGLPSGLPLFVGLGDNQAGFLGSVPSANGSELVNVGTGAQVARWSAEPPPPEADLPPELEIRPYPGAGVLVVYAEVSGGRSYAALHGLFRSLLEGFGVPVAKEQVYARMAELAAQAPPGAGGLLCDSRFAGTRSAPSHRGSLTGLSEANLTAGHLARAVLEGMAASLHDGSSAITRLVGHPPVSLIGAGNGFRRNPLLAQILSEQFALPVALPPQSEEAALGAAMAAGWGAAHGGPRA
ncbi:MAG: FGGY family carbohydrate kinase [Armatimonadetes bacterium]|nr:FGGY family carbohydrate kinase [Armatimonadota bacterium]